MKKTFTGVRTSPDKPKYKSPLIKWYNTTLTYEEKYKLGLMTYQEYMEWQQMLAMGIDPDSNAGQDPASATSSNTFWKDDEEERTNISTDAYSDFLADNNIDISNKTAVDFDSLAAQINNEPAQTSSDAVQSEIVHLTEEEILANVNRDIHGGNTILSEEEIAALFAAANNN